MAKYSVKIESYSDIDLVSNTLANTLDVEPQIIKNKIKNVPCMFGSAESYEKARIVADAVIDTGGKATIISLDLNNSNRSTKSKSTNTRKPPKTGLKIFIAIALIASITIFIMAILSIATAVKENSPENKDSKTVLSEPTPKSVSTPKPTTTPTLTQVEQARMEVIDKYRNESGVLGTSKFIEDFYKKYPNDEVISNIYFYCIAKEEYDNYLQFSYNDGYLVTAKEYAAKIDPNYKGEFSTEMHSLVKKLLPSDNYEQVHKTASTQEQKYNSLSNSEKKAIGNFIHSRYEYYDKKNGGYAGDKYSDTIMQEAADKYGLSVSQIKIIWMNYYSY